LVISYACQQIIWPGAAMANHIVAVVSVIVVVVEAVMINISAASNIGGGILGYWVFGIRNWKFGVGSMQWSTSFGVRLILQMGLA